MEIKIIINEGEASPGPEARRPRRGERFVDAGRQTARRECAGCERSHRGESRGRRPGEEPRHEFSRYEGPRRERRDDRLFEGRVIGKLVEMPDGRIRVVRRGEGRERGIDRPRHSDYRGEGHSDHRRERFAGSRYPNEEEREARRARRRLIRRIVRAIESGELGEA